MSDFIWLDEYNTGIPSIDEQHKGFLKVMDINVATVTVASMQTPIVEKLDQYAKKHFTYEEGLLHKYGYYEQSKHKEAHREFMKSIENFETRINQGQKIPLVEFYKFILNWLIAHIVSEDKKYAPFLIHRGVK